MAGDQLAQPDRIVWMSVLVPDRLKEGTMFSDKQWVLTAIVEAPPDAIFQRIVAIKQREVRALGSQYGDALTSDQAHRSVTLTGHWWYQGSHSVHSHPAGSLVTYRVRNIARVARTLAFVQRPLYKKEMRRDFALMLGQLCAHDGWPFRIEQG